MLEDVYSILNIAQEQRRNTNCFNSLKTIDISTHGTLILKRLLVLL